MKKLLLLFALALPAFSQTPVPNGPVDCLQQFFFSTGNGTQNLDNRSTGCDQWTIVYQASGTLSGYTLAFNVATGETAPGSFGAYSGNVVNSSASFGTAASGIETLCDLASCATMGTTVYNPWVQIAVTGASGTGSVRGTLYGYRTGYTAGTGGSGGGGGGGAGCPNPCPVVGTAASGAAPSGDPVQAAGYDGTDIRTLRTDSSGRPVVVGGAASGAVPVGNPVPVAGFDGTDTRNVSTDSTGRVNVNVNGTVPVSGACPNPCPIVGNTGATLDAAAGAAVPTNTLQVGGSDGTDIRALKTDTSGDLSTFQIGLGAFTSAQQAVTASAVNLGTNTAKSVCVHALIANTINVYAGATGVTTSTGMEIPPGQGYCWSVSNTNLVYVIASTTGASVSVTWTN